jgi:methylglutaconyl-CoA hydratase
VDGLVAPNGTALGGGVGLACVCDTVIAAESAKFGFTETRLGLIPATIGPYVIARMGEGRARRVFMSARIFDAAEAHDLSIVSRTVSISDLDSAVEAEVEPYLSTAPGAVGAAKSLVRALGPTITASMIDDSISRLVHAWETDEAAEGVSAFLQKRPPKWR